MGVTTKQQISIL